MPARSTPGDPSAPLPPHLDPRGRHRGGRGGGRSDRGGGRLWGSGATRVVLSLLTVLSVFLLAAAGYYWYTYRAIDKNVHRGHIAVGATPSGHTATIDRKDQNILLVGIDDRTNMTNAEVKSLHVGRDGGSMATDTMMIVHVPANGSKATLISLPRDSYVKIPGYGMNRINAAYSDGYRNASGSYDDKRTAGASLLTKTITNLTGLTINHYIQVSFMGFYEISKAIGGVTVNLCHPVDDTVAYNKSIGGDGGSGFKMSAGKHKLTPVETLEFVRQRHNFPDGNGDFDRVRRQQYFLTAAFRQVASVGLLFKLNALGDAVTRNLFVDQGMHLTDLAQQMENLSANNIVGKTIPFQGYRTVPSLGSVNIVSPSRVQAFVDKLVTGPKSSPSSGSSGSSAPTTGTTSSTPGGATTTAPKPIDAKCIS